MKRLLILSLLVVGAMTINAQKAIYTPVADVVQGDTNYIPSEAGYDVTFADGIVSYTFTHTDTQDSLSIARLEGSNNGTNWYALTGNAAITNTSTDGESVIYASNPLTYLKYRAIIACAANDTVSISNQTFIIKRGTE